MSNRELPQGWQWIRLDDICEKKTGIRNPENHPDTAFSYVDISSVDNTLKRIVEPKQLLGRDAPSRARQIIKCGDVIVATTRPNLNAVALVPSELDNQICSTGVCVLRPSKQLLPEYLFAYVQTQEFIENLSELVKGAMYPAVTDSQVRSQFIPLPPIDEQHRIAGILNDYLSDIEQARVRVQEQLAATEQLTGAYLRELFESDEAQNWEVYPLGDICKFSGQYGTSEKAHDEPVGLPVLRMGNIRNGSISWKDLKYISLPATEEAKYILNAGDIIFNRTNSAELVGKTAVFTGEKEAVFASYLIRFQVKELLADPHYVSAYINSPLGRKFIEANMTRAIGQVNISASTMAKMPIPLPSLNEQRRKITIFNEQNIEIQNLVRVLTEQLEALDKLPATLLRQAFDGEL